MALTAFPEDTSDLNRKTSRDVRCSCGQRRTIDGYDEPTAAACIAEDCDVFFIIPAYPFTNDDIELVTGRDAAKTAMDEQKN